MIKKKHEWVFNNTEEEIIVVESKVSGKKIRFIYGYGPQDDDNDEVRDSFSAE